MVLLYARNPLGHGKNKLSSTMWGPQQIANFNRGFQTFTAGDMYWLKQPNENIT